MDDLDPVTRELVRLRGRFALREAYAMSVALVVALLALPTLVYPVGAGDETTTTVLQVLLVGPLVFGCWSVFRHLRIARPLMLYAFALYVAITAVPTENPAIWGFYGFQALLVATLWLPPIDAVLRESYYEDVISAAPLAGRGRRGGWVVVLGLLWIVGSFASGVLALSLAT